MFWFTDEDKRVKTKELTREQQVEALVWKFFMEKLPRLGFEQREGQEDMALDICNAISEKQHTVVEAGVGIGKSYAYIVPLLYYNKLFGKPVIIATSTIALQEQLIEDIKRVSSYINHRPEVILAKGMTHFACKRRADEVLKPKAQMGLYEEEETLYRYIYGGKVDRRYISMDISEELWSSVNVEMTDHSSCKHFKNCRFMDLRKDMYSTDGVILCNQDLLTVHLQKLRRGQKGLLNPEADLVVIDEAHNLEEKVRTSLIESFTKESIRNIMMEGKNGVKDIKLREHIYGKVKELMETLNPVFKELHNQIDYQLEKSDNPEDMEKFFINLYDIRGPIGKAEGIVKYVYNVLRKNVDNSVPDDIMDEIDNLKVFFKEMNTPRSNYLFWLERHKTLRIFACPKNMNTEIKSLYFDKLKTTILTSATIADKQEGEEREVYEYFIKSTGFPVKEGFLSPPKESPFPYNKNAMLYYAEDMPHPVKEREAFIRAGADEIERLIKITEGRALILFTAKSDLRAVYEILKERNLGVKVLRQRSSSSQDELLHEFKENEKSILLATGTFWEGIDVPGKALCNVIIFKLPFPVPDPIIEYKRNTCEDFLMEVSVPLMIVKLRQGVGRLIRKQSDKGIVAILDPRLGDKSKSRYKEIVFKALPIKKRTNNLEKIKAFWNKVK